MKTLALFYLLIIITVSVSVSKANHRSEGGGFTLDLIHRDSPLSPVYDPTYARWDRLQNAFVRSIYRASRLSKRAGLTSKMSLDADVIGILGEYVMHIKIGNPPVEVVGIADTGSDLTWAQCQPCKHCFKHGDLPFLQPNTSSTYRPVSCQSKACGALDTDRIRCGSENLCLGSGPLSIIKQLDDTIQGKFSYCLVQMFHNVSNATAGKIHFGDHAVVTGPDVVSTPLKTTIPPTYYYVTLEHVSVGNRKLPYKSAAAMKNSGFNGQNIIIDSGTTLTLVSPDFHYELTAALTKAIGLEPIPDPTAMFDLCYKDLDLNRVPTVTFSFTGADVELPAQNTFIEVEEGVSCFTIVGADGIAIFGNLSQQNLLVGFDLVNKKVSFRPTLDCRNQN
ncbi:hypothetical protein L6452_38676 [Arctium lappa]|uniref:Uncharacterized protein n=1 Tax=Arctium lappa TaxID=4217 RepID=A0ACB8XQ74_ARCLA|nr:hypothetical protein L6452_38676 [Arctium lappa]